MARANVRSTLGRPTCGSVNRERLRDCTNFMAKLVPLVIEAMMDHPETLWWPGTYPVVRRPAATPRPRSPAHAARETIEVFQQ
jgi:hypothetical protein